MSILSTNSRLIKVGQDYSAGSGISIDDNVISVTGEFGKTYSAGDNIDIYEQGEQLYISSKDWTNDIANASANAYNEAVSQIPDPFDPTFISAKVDNKLDTTAFTNWQNGQYSTDLQTIEGQISNKLDVSAFGEVSGSFLTAINIPESAVWQDVSTTVQSNSAQWADGGTGCDEEVNSFVYDNSATIVDVDNSYKANSGSFLTASPSDMATTGDVAELAQTISETYQTKGDYLVRSESANFYPMEGNPSGFLTDDNTVVLQYGTSTWAEFKSAYDAHKNIMMYHPDTGDITNQYATFGYVDFDGEPFVASFTTICYGVEYRFTLNSNNVWHSYSQPLQNRGNYYSASNPSGFITGVNIPESATWNEVSTTVQTNSAQWGQGGTGGDEEVNSFVYNNSATINEVNTTYQTNSGSYQPSGNYIPYTAVNKVFNAFQTNSGLDVRTTIAGSLRSTSLREDSIRVSYIHSPIGINNHSTLTTDDLTFSTSSDSAYVDMKKIKTWDSASNYIQNISSTWNETSDVVQTNSAQWAEGGGGVTGEFVPQSAFDELKQSYDALSSLFATYSGQWLLPNEGV